MDPTAALTLALSPHGGLFLAPAEAEEQALPTALAERLGALPPGDGGGLLLHLGVAETASELPALPRFWRDLGRSFALRLRAVPDLESLRERVEVAPPREEWEDLAAAAPPMPGGEYLAPPVLAALWGGMQEAFRRAVAAYPGTVADWFHASNPLWRMVGRICFHLAENRNRPDRPFAFLATYTSRLSEGARLQHLPLERALREYADDREALRGLLTPIHEAARNSVFLRALADSGEIFHPLSWTVDEAYRFLQDVPCFEEGGVVVRLPDWWNPRRPPRPQVRLTLGDRPPVSVGLGALLDFRVELTLDGEPLSEEEWRGILAAADRLVRIRGKWVEVDREKLSEVLEHWERVGKRAGEDGLSFIEGMRLLAGAGLEGGETLPPEERSAWSVVAAGRWVAGLLDGGSAAAGLSADPGDALKAELRPYQRKGVQWLRLLHRLRLGACLADDMGLGKTMQVLALLLLLQAEAPGHVTLLVAPASLLANWRSEAERFAPGLRLLTAHASATPPEDLAAFSPEAVRGYDLVITSYASLFRLPWVAETEWSLVVLDEAQAVKNPGARQTRSAKALRAGARLALTGTPVENRLTDLWSLFDFLNPGLLGSSREFGRFAKALGEGGPDGFAPLRRLTRPYILRRMKTDRSVIADLPDKTEVVSWCALSPRQAALYQQAVEELERLLQTLDGIRRRGVILSFLMRFKQICNHPAHWLGSGEFPPDESGKFDRLGEIAETVASRREKALVFTQFREMTDPLERFLAGVFGRPGLVLHGGTPVRRRKELVDTFQRDDGPPFFVLSMKAGGTGLNLTEAGHVIHFDRWWNPAVENQATDRAFRIGQHRNVLVHKFVCRGTVEEKIHELIEGKKAISRDVVDGGGEAVLTELDNRELLRVVALDLRSALGDA
ncbi:MAG: DEAD/DEAH box helicase [Acidobacteria bacterium]|nr:DEAD/DEAH box helicase [Acidobacteriota bacterium]